MYVITITAQTLDIHYQWLANTTQTLTLLTLRQLNKSYNMCTVFYITTSVIQNVKQILWIVPILTGRVPLMDDSQRMSDCL